MDWGPDDRLYGPRWFRGEVARVDVDSGAVETVATGFRIPAAVKFDSEGRLHVLDTQAGEVVRLDLASGTRQVVGRPGTGLDNLALDAADRIFVSSFTDGSIVEVTGPDTIRQVLPSHVNSPGGIAYTPEGRLFLADGAALRELDPSTGASLHAAGALVSDVVNVEAGRVTRVDVESGTATAVAIGRALGGTTSVGELAGIAVGAGELFVAAYRDNRVYRIEP